MTCKSTRKEKYCSLKYLRFRPEKVWRTWLLLRIGTSVIVTSYDKTCPQQPARISRAVFIPGIFTLDRTRYLDIIIRRLHQRKPDLFIRTSVKKDKDMTFPFPFPGFLN